jgi:signal peptidase I
MEPTLRDQQLLIVDKLTYWRRDPRAGDLVMIVSPADPNQSLVRRLIAREGDTIQIRGGQLYINDQRVGDEYVPAEFRSHDDWGPAVVPSGFYFVLGDHRTESTDSRHWRFVPRRYIVGKVVAEWGAQRPEQVG